MNGPPAICPAAGSCLGGRRLAVGSPHGGPGAAVVPAELVAAPLLSAGRELWNAWSDTEPHPASRAAQATAIMTARRVIGTPSSATGVRRGLRGRSRAR